MRAMPATMVTQSFMAPALRSQFDGRYCKANLMKGNGSAPPRDMRRRTALSPVGYPSEPSTPAMRPMMLDRFELGAADTLIAFLLPQMGELPVKGAPEYPVGPDSGPIAPALALGQGLLGFTKNRAGVMQQHFRPFRQYHLRVEGFGYSPQPWEVIAGPEGF